VTTYLQWQQQRGVAWDTIDWVIEEYRCFMLDDDYDAQGALDRIVGRLREVRALYSAQGMPSEGPRRECGSGASAPASPVANGDAPKGSSHA
jgi:hypothetical protein